MSQLIPFQLLIAGEAGTVVGVSGSARDVQHLAELGLTIGTAVQMERPGSPCIIRLNQQRLTMRLASTVTVLVERDG